MKGRDLLGSVVIPAHNEAAVILRCLDALLTALPPGELDVVVACNGCIDGTADIVRSSGYPVRVIEVETASKSAALRAAEEEMDTAFPRLYLDADVVLKAASADRVLERLRIGPALAARPPIKYDTKSCTPLVRSYYRARAGVPAVMGSLWGAGVYGLSETGRARFGPYPDVVADDLFVDQYFRRLEVEIVNAPPVVVSAPRRTAVLLRNLRRIHQGNWENRTLPSSHATQSATTSSTVHDLARLASAGPSKAIDAATYAGLATLARLTLAVPAPTHWERDNSSRVGPRGRVPAPRPRPPLRRE
jgi:glycosyltransferase involved in cell wall biosynthesis